MLNSQMVRMQNWQQVALQNACMLNVLRMNLTRLTRFLDEGLINRGPRHLPDSQGQANDLNKHGQSAQANM